MEKLEERSAGQGRSALMTQADPMGAPEPERPSSFRVMWGQA